MAKIQIKSEKLILFGGMFSSWRNFDATLSSVIDSGLGLRCRLFHFMARFLAMYKTTLCFLLKKVHIKSV